MCTALNNDAWSYNKRPTSIYEERLEWDAFHREMGLIVEHCSVLHLPGDALRSWPMTCAQPMGWMSGERSWHQKPSSSRPSYAMWMRPPTQWVTRATLTEEMRFLSTTSSRSPIGNWPRMHSRTCTNHKQLFFLPVSFGKWRHKIKL